MYTLCNIKNCMYLLFTSPVLFYISIWNSVCKLKMIYATILPKNKGAYIFNSPYPLGEYFVGV